MRIITCIITARITASATVRFYKNSHKIRTSSRYWGYNPFLCLYGKSNHTVVLNSITAEEKMFDIFNKSTNFTINDIPDLQGKIAIVTGANTGIGFITAQELARKNAHVFVACRDQTKGEKAISEIKRVTGNDKVEYLPLNLSSLKSVLKATELFLDRKLPLHILVNNAGIMATPFTLTEDGIQDQFGINHIGHFLFTIKLLPTIEASAPSRIVNLTSLAHNRAPKCGIDFENLNNPNAYGSFSRYGQSKLANILFSLELNKRLADKEVYVNSVHPGVVKTDLYRNLKDSMGFLAKPIEMITGLIMISSEEGAMTSLYCATSPEIIEKNLRGKYFVPNGKLSNPEKSGTDEDLALKLWKYSEELINKKLNS
ncbi:3620_t:CDS:2 [Diversispora eburnea]|uniref:3620_t:CDS:1 n=1 Tax=Diversispora eburnea TaxID=1213867 RepID=A0A9N8WER4_9GLOM|nr:3620_t:CDS:2 [Diversispora eburnea]